jgi:hypothetical protein
LLSLSVFSAALALAQLDIGRVLPEHEKLKILAFGDFGTGAPSQVALARAMTRRNSETHFNLGLTMGDNFYQCGVRSVNDPKWKTRWEDLYTPLGIPFYASLGNHDYGHPPAMCPGMGASPEAEIARTKMSPSWRMPARYYTFAAGPARFFAIDTEGWNPKQLEWIRNELELTSTERGIRWRIVYGHHPIYTSGKHINERRIAQLRRELLPVLMRYGVDLYLCGHDHDIEHLRSDGIDFLISGGGGAHLRSMGRRGPQSVFAKTVFAFTELKIDQHELVAEIFDVDLNLLENPPLKRVKSSS